MSIPNLVRRAARSAVRVAAVVIIAAPAACAAAQSDEGSGSRTGLISDDSLARAVEEYTARMEGVGFSGVVLVERGGRVLHARGRGFADREAERPFTTSTVWSMGSITKPFTATAILRLVQAGRLALSDTLGLFIENLPPDRAGTTVEQLLLHRGGLAAPAEGDFDRVDRDRIEQIARETELEFPPGDTYNYSNLGYSLLGVVLEKVADEPYESFLRRELLIPAGLYQTGYVEPKWDPSLLAVGYRAGDRFGTLADRMPPDGPYWILRANGGLHTNAFDMLRWVRASLRGEVFGPELATQLVDTRIERFPGSALSLGWALDTSRPHAVSVHHDGSNGIFWADVRFFPRQDLVIIVASNVAEWTAQNVAAAIEGLAFGEPVALPPRLESVTVSASAREALAGRWTVPGEGTIDVSWTGESLELAIEGQSLLNRVLRPSDDEPTFFEQLNGRSAAAVAAMQRGDRDSLASILGLERVSGPLAGAIDALAQGRGAFTGFEVLGTAPVWYVTPYATWVRLHFERGTTIRRLHWDADGGYVGFGGQAYRAPLILPCVGTGPRQCTAFHRVIPMLPANISVSNGTLRLHAGAESVTAHRERG